MLNVTGPDFGRIPGRRRWSYVRECVVPDDGVNRPVPRLLVSPFGKRVPVTVLNLDVRPWTRKLVSQVTRFCPGDSPFPDGAPVCRVSVTQERGHVPGQEGRQILRGRHVGVFCLGGRTVRPLTNLGPSSPSVDRGVSRRKSEGETWTGSGTRRGVSRTRHVRKHV